MQLAKASAFKLGPLVVDPSARSLRSGERSEFLEPRVMRVLVALGETPGQVLSREDLIEMCWDGQIVSDNAINRVISLLRRVLDHLADGMVRLETITKVGFRIVATVVDQAGADSLKTDPDETNDAPAPVSAAPPRKWTRRAVAFGAVAAGGAAALAYAAWNHPVRHVPDPRAFELYNRGWRTKETQLPGSMRQAMAFWKQAVAIDPNYADAWGALAMGYRHGGDGFVDGPRDSFPRLVRSAADRALALDPDQPDALLALVTMYPDYGMWHEHEGGLRSLVTRDPSSWHAWGLLDILMQDVGRFDQGIIYRRRMQAIKSDMPIGWAALARGLQFAGRDHEADLTLDQAFDRWPAHGLLWITRWQLLIGGKRFAEAAAFVRDLRSRPDDVPDEVVGSFARTADALATRRGTEAILSEMRTGPFRIEQLPMRAILAVELGDADMAFEQLHAYYFGGKINGQPVPFRKSVDPRETAMLFSPSLLALKSDPRHADILNRTGLEDYWRRSGTQPDYRKRAKSAPAESG